MVPLVERRSSFVIQRLFGDSMRCNSMKGAFSYTFELEMCYVSQRVLDFGPFSTSVHQRLRPPEPF